MLPYQIFHRYAEQYPDAIALIYRDSSDNEQTISYRVLDNHSNQLARHLIEVEKLQPGTTVAVCLTRGSPNLALCVLAIWKAGLVYFPVSGEFSDQSKADAFTAISNRLKKTDTKLIITDYVLKLVFGFADFNCFCIDTHKNAFANLATEYFENKDVRPTNYAYICSSSGTTAEPKLIVNKFEGLEGRATGLAELMQINRSSCLLAYSKLDFDASIMDMLMAWFKGAALYLLQNDINLENLFQKAKSRKITHAVLVPKVVKGPGEGIDPKNYPGLKAILVMGDICSKSWLKKLFDGDVKIYTGYGPTETSIAATGVTVLPGTEITLGLPLQGVNLYLKHNDGRCIFLNDNITNDEELEGELYIGGMGVGHYWNNAQKNLESFEKITVPRNDYVYKTGDIVRLARNNELYFLSRRDRQIKRNGKLTKLDDIERELMKSKLLDSVAVVCYEDYVIAYVVLKTQDNNVVEQLYTHVSKCNDTRLHPNFCVSVTKLPVTGRDKFEHKKLTSFLSENPRLLTLPHESPCKTELQKNIADIWFKLLFPTEIHELIGVKDPRQLISTKINFFVLGGDSLSFAAMLDAVWKTFCAASSNNFGYRTTPNDFAQYIQKNPTIEQIILYLEMYQRNICYKVVDKATLPLFYLQVRENDIKFNQLQNKCPCSVLKITPVFNLEKDSRSELDAIATHCVSAIRKNQMIGPYHLAAANRDMIYLLGIANVLESQGEIVYLCHFTNDESLNIPEHLSSACQIARPQDIYKIVLNNDSQIESLVGYLEIH